MNNRAFELLLAVVSDVYEVPAGRIMGRSRLQVNVTPRQALAYAGKELINLAFAEMGRKMGRDHSTIIKAHESYGLWLQESELDRTRMAQIVKEFGKRVMETGIHKLDTREKVVDRLRDLRRANTSYERCAEQLDLPVNEVKRLCAKYALSLTPQQGKTKSERTVDRAMRGDAPVKKANGDQRFAELIAKQTESFENVRVLDNGPMRIHRPDTFVARVANS